MAGWGVVRGEVRGQTCTVSQLTRRCPLPTLGTSRSRQFRFQRWARAPTGRFLVAIRLAGPDAARCRRAPWTCVQGAGKFA